jgi:hypothetical protein
MTTRRFVVLIAVLLGVFAGFQAQPVDGQTPRLTAYFNASGTRQEHCELCDPYHPGPDYSLTVYFVLENFNAYVTAVQFSVSYPYLVTWLADGPMPPTSFGTSPTGVAMAWGLPQNAYGSFVVLEAYIVYHATCSHDELRIEVWDHPVLGSIAAVRWGDNKLVELQGGYASFCSRVVPVEVQSWGAIKSLYR